MNTALRKCVDCGRLFAAPGGAQQCHKCANDEISVFKRIQEAVTIEERKTIPDIALHLGVDAGVVRRVLAEMPHLARQVENDEICPRCGIRPAKIGRDFCVSCLAALNVDIRDTVGLVELRNQLRNRRPEARFRDMSVGEVLRAKRHRTGHHRLDPEPPNIKRGR